MTRGARASSVASWVRSPIYSLAPPLAWAAWSSPEHAALRHTAARARRAHRLGLRTERLVDDIVAALLEECWQRAPEHVSQTTPFSVPTSATVVVPEAWRSDIEGNPVGVRKTVFDLLNEEAGRCGWPEAPALLVTMEYDAAGTRAMVRTIGWEDPTELGAVHPDLCEIGHDPYSSVRARLGPRSPVHRVSRDRLRLSDDSTVPRWPIELEWRAPGVVVIQGLGIELTHEGRRIAPFTEIPLVVGDTIEIRCRNEDGMWSTEPFEVRALPRDGEP